MTKQDEKAERATMLRLQALRDAGIELDATTTSRLAELEARWKADPPPVDVPVLTERAPEPTLDLATASEVEVATALRRNPWDPAIASHLDALEDQPAQLIQLLNRTIREYDPSSRENLGRLAQGLPPQLPLELGTRLRSIANKVDTDLLGSFLDCWDHVLEKALLQVSDSMEGEHDEVFHAMNHPAGRLAEALFGAFSRGSVQRGSGIDDALSYRLGYCLGLCGDISTPFSTIVATRLLPLHVADESWTAAAVLPRMSWKHPERARAMWQGYLTNPRINSSLGQAIRDELLRTFDYFEELGPWGDRLSGLLVAIGLNPEDATVFSMEQFRSCLRRLPPSGRTAVAWHLAKVLEGAEDKSAALWDDRVQPWLTEVWPPDSEFRGEPETSDRLGWMVTKTGAAFGRAVEAVLPLLGRFGDRCVTLHELSKEDGLAAVYPAASLRLVNALTPEEPRQWHVAVIRQFLDIVRPSEGDSLEYRRLDAIAL